MKITIENIDELLRFAQYLGIKRIKWKEEHFNLLDNFVTAGGWTTKNYIEYMDIKHYKVECK